MLSSCLKSFEKILITMFHFSIFVFTDQIAVLLKNSFFR